MSHQAGRPKTHGSTMELTHFEQTKAVLDEIVPLEVHALAVQEFLRSDVADQRAVNAAGLRAVQHFADFFCEKLVGRPDISPEAIRDAAIVMALGVLDEFKKAALMQMGGFGPDVAPGAPIVRH